MNDPEIRLEISYPAGRDHPLGGYAMQISAVLPEVVLPSRCVGEKLPKRGKIKGNLTGQ